MQDLHKDKLKVLDTTTLEAIRAVFNEELATWKPDISGDNKLIGEKYRAYVLASTLVLDVLNKIGAYRTDYRPTNKFNKER